jgi:hypothetical protein
MPPQLQLPLPCPHTSAQPQGSQSPGQALSRALSQALTSWRCRRSLVRLNSWIRSSSLLSKPRSRQFGETEGSRRGQKGPRKALGHPGEKLSPSLRVMTWNASNLTHSGRELGLVNLLASNRADIMVVTETELPELLAPMFAVPGYTAFLSPQSKYLDKHRVMTLVKSNLAVLANARICEECELSRTDGINDEEPPRPSTQTVWV